MGEQRHGSGPALHDRGACNAQGFAWHRYGMNTPKNPQKPRPSLRRRIVRVVAVAAAVLFVAAVFLFEPWNLVIDKHVDEAAPVASAPVAAIEPVVLARGTLISHEHQSSGTVALLRLADGSRVLRVENLQTSNGPDLHVWITDAPVIEGTDGWTVFDDGRYVDLGELKGNIGSSNYPIPADADLTGLSSVSIWCARFHVSFAAAQLLPTA
jgi:electron transfer DM13